MTLSDYAEKINTLIEAGFGDLEVVFDETEVRFSQVVLVGKNPSVTIRKYGNDLSDCSSEENMLDCAKDVMNELAGEMAPHGEHGVDSLTLEFIYAESVYTLSSQFEWNRHDKQYYFIEDCYTEITIVAKKPHTKGDEHGI